MDHLLMDGTIPPIVVPYLLPDNFTYDGEDFDGYPERQGWDFTIWRKDDRTRHNIDIEKWLEGSDRDESHLLAFLQAWLFFGLLACALDTQVNVEDFVRFSDVPGDKLITTAKLDAYLIKFASRNSALNDHEKDRASIRFTNIMTVVAVRLRTLEDTIKWGQPPQRQALEEVHFIANLASATIAALGDWIYNKSRKLDDRSLQNIGMGRSPLIVRHMRSGGWCPNTINRTTSLFHADMQAYAIALGSIHGRRDHSRCTTQYCFANQAGDDFVPTHQVNCDSNSCLGMSAPMSDVIKILENGHIPVLEIELEEVTSLPRFRVMKADKATPYVAISHVWSPAVPL